MIRTRVLSIAAGVALLVTASVATFAIAAGTDDAAEATALIQQLDADTAHKALVADTLTKAKEALERGHRMRTAGDDAHAKLADAVAREWAETARDLVRAADLEKVAAASRSGALDAGARVEREQSAVEESIARVGRLRAELEAAERDTKAQKRVATEPLDGGVMPKKHKRPAGANEVHP
jgi:colicin import membrane protein